MQIPGAESNRFRASRLSQIESRSGFFLFRRFSSRRREGQPVAPKSRFARIMDKVLLGIEIICAIIVAWIAVQYIYTVYFDTAPHRLTPAALPTSTTPTAGAIATATPRATPTLFVEILPPETGGPGDEGGTGSAPTLPPLQQLPTPAATATIAPELLLPSRLRIPVMFLDSPVHEVMVNMGQWEVAPMDIGHHEGTANPGEVGNMVLAGHRDINSALFRELDRLKPGDDVFVSNSFGEYHYIVRESLVVGPDHTEVMDPTPDHRLTLITCTPVGIDTQRLIVIATLDGSGE
jgi:LPXTG-site transpeptidase (sortase) family protein